MYYEITFDYDSEFFVTILRIIFSGLSALKQSPDSVDKSQWCYKTLRHCGYHHIQGKFPSYMYVYWLLLFLKRHCLNISIHAIIRSILWKKIKIVYRKWKKFKKTNTVRQMLRIIIWKPKIIQNMIFSYLFKIS